MYLGFSQFYYLTNVGDLEDLIPAYQSELEQRHGGNCNGYVKLQNGEISVAHNTHNIYAFLLRIFKSYNFPTRD